MKALAFWGAGLLLAAIFTIALPRLVAVTPPEPLALDHAQMSTVRGGSGAQLLSLPDDWRTRPEDPGVVWYALSVQVDSAPTSMWGVYIPALEMTPAVYVNGTLIGGVADTGARLPRYWNQPVYYPVPGSLLRVGANDVEVRLAANGRWGRLDRLYVGPDDVLGPVFEEHYFWRTSFPQVVTLGALMLGLVVGVLGWLRREVVYLYFAVFAVTWYLLGLFFSVTHIPIANHLWDLYAYALIAGVVVSGGLFIFEFAGREARGWRSVAVGALVVGLPVLLVMSFWDVALFNFVGSTLWSGAYLVMAAYPIVLLARQIPRMSWLDGVCLCASFAVALFVGVHDWSVSSGLISRHGGMFLQFAALPLLITFGLMLVRRFVLALDEADTLNSDLHALVDEKAREIEKGYARNRELEREQVLARERERMMREMHDGVGGQLIGMMAGLDDASPREQALKQEMALALSDLRLMIDSLDDLGTDLTAVLGVFRHRVGHLVEGAGLKLSWKVADLPDVAELGPDRVAHLLRILQEAVTNIVRHADATEVSIATHANCAHEGRNGHLISIEDDGIGFDPDAVSAGRGLDNIRYRARQAGFALSLTSQPSGTRVSIWICAR